MSTLNLTTRSERGGQGPLTAEGISALKSTLQAAVSALASRRADLLGAQSVADYVELDWMTWHGGSLKLTTVGENICAQLRKEARALEAVGSRR